MTRMGQQHSRVHVDIRECYVKLRKRKVVPKNNDQFQGFRHWPVYVYSCLLLYIELTRTSQTHAFSCIQKHCRKSMKSLPGHRSRTPHAQLELLLNILQTLLVSCLVPRLGEFVPPDPEDVCRNCDWYRHGEEDPQIRRGNWAAWCGIECEGIVHAEE
jgi:hypothetical protein